MSVVAEARARLARQAQNQSSESEVGGVEASISAVLHDPTINDVGLYERLVRKVGLGQMPAKRKALFQRLVKLHRLEPDKLELLIADAWSSSCGARFRDRYFCVAVCRKLAEAGLSCGGSEGVQGDVI